MVKECGKIKVFIIRISGAMALCRTIGRVNANRNCFTGPFVINKIKLSKIIG